MTGKSRYPSLRRESVLRLKLALINDGDKEINVPRRPNRLRLMPAQLRRPKHMDQRGHWRLEWRGQCPLHRHSHMLRMLLSMYRTVVG